MVLIHKKTMSCVADMIDIVTYGVYYKISVSEV